MRRYLLISIIWFFSTPLFSQVQVGISGNGYFSMLELKGRGAEKHPGGSFSVFVRNVVKENRFKENVFLDVGISGTFIRGFYQLEYIDIPYLGYDSVQVSGWDKNYLIGVPVKVGYNFNVRNQTLVLLGGVEPYYLPKGLNQNISSVTRRLGLNLLLEPGLLIRKFKPVSSVHITLKRNLLSFNTGGHQFYNTAIGLSIVKVF